MAWMTLLVPRCIFININKISVGTKNVAIFSVFPWPLILIGTFNLFSFLFSFFLYYLLKTVFKWLSVDILFFIVIARIIITCAHKCGIFSIGCVSRPTAGTVFFYSDLLIIHSNVTNKCWGEKTWWKAKNFWWRSNRGEADRYCLSF